MVPIWKLDISGTAMIGWRVNNKYLHSPGGSWARKHMMNPETRSWLSFATHGTEYRLSYRYDHSGGNITTQESGSQKICFFLWRQAENNR